MRELTTAADLALRVAGLEAQRGRATAIGLDHLLVGLLSLDKLLEPSAGLDPEQGAAVRSEHEILTHLLGQIGLAAPTLRRAIRARILPGAGPPTASLRRDAACYAAFERGARLAREYGHVRCGVLHVMAAALELSRREGPLSPSAGPLSLPGDVLPGDIERLRAQVTVALASTRSDERAVATPLLGPDVTDQPPQPSQPEPGESPIQPPRPTTEPGAIAPSLHEARPGPVLSASPASAHDSLSMPPESPGHPRLGRQGSRSTPPASPSNLPPPLQPSFRPGVPAALLRYGRDLTAEAESGRLGPVIGRHEEMLQVVRVLHRRTKNSPVLIGEAGVGKTAVVEGLALRIAEGTALPGRRIVALSLASVVAGTTYRGQFEERLEEILSELRSHPHIIVFLDELHTVVGAGDSDGRLDAANILKPALSRGEIACIGATTADEYRRHIESDAALERRFQPVLVSEPTTSQARAILEGVRDVLERHHAVSIAADALDAAVDLTARYVTGRRLPDKAVDALDEACARASVPTLTHRPGQAVNPGHSGQAVTRETVAAVVAAWTGIPLGRIGQAESDWLADLEAHLGQRVVGQPDAIRQVAQRVRLARTGLSDPNRPAGVLLFLGPSGVGKTELAMTLGDAVVHGAEGQPRLIRLDMSEYSERHHTARLIGAPPGYLGYEADGQLTGPLRRNPHAVVLLDEVEKAHPEVFDLFLHLFDAGRLTDGHGQLVDGRQAIFVLTSNLLPTGAGRRVLGFGRESGRVAAPGGTRASTDERGDSERHPADREALLAELRSCFRPELLNRIDELVVFRPLSEADLVEIARRRTVALRQRLMARHTVDLTVSSAALAFLAHRASSGSGGARDVQRAVTRLIEEPLSRELLAGRLLPGERMIVEVRADSLDVVRDTSMT